MSLPDMDRVEGNRTKYWLYYGTYSDHSSHIIGWNVVVLADVDIRILIYKYFLKKRIFLKILLACKHSGFFYWMCNKF